jgi:hypothetical protein
MKTNRIVVKFFILASILLLLVFSGCQDQLEQSGSRPIPKASIGKGFFKFDLGKVAIGRTILPATPESKDFVVFELEFLSGGEVVKKVDHNPSDPSEPITLDVGIYELHVTAYLDTVKTKPAAWGSKTGIEIKNGETTSTSIELAAITNKGQGTFNWTISYPTTRAISGSMKITPIVGTSGTVQTKALANETTDSLNLGSGYYRVVFTLRDNASDEGVERWEILHIYQNMESVFTWDVEDSQFHSYTTRVSNGNDSGAGSLRQAISEVLSDGTIVVDDSVKTIQLTTGLDIYTKSFVLEGNSVNIQASSLSSGYVISIYEAVVTIRRVHFSNTQTSIINNISGNLSLESCVFSDNNSNYTIITSQPGGTTNIKGSTFYKNSVSYYGGVIYSYPSTPLTLVGNLFFENTATNNSMIALSNNVISNGYNVVDVPLGTGTGQSGWVKHNTDKVTSDLPITSKTFKPISGRGAQNVITTRPAGYPTEDFYGNPIPSSSAAAGAVQVVANGYLIDLSVNDSSLGSASITSAPVLNSDGLYNSGSVTFKAISKGPTGYSFQNWQVNNCQYTANPLTLTLDDHYKVQAVFGRKLPDSVKRVLFSGSTETVTLSGLNNNDVYLVKVNTSPFAVNAANTGGSSGSSPSIISGNVLPSSNETLVPRMGHPEADKFHANPPPIDRKKLKNKSNNRPLDSFISWTEGETTQFWVESAHNNGKWVQKLAKLAAQGGYGNIWVMKDDDGNYCIADTLAKELADKFDEIYPIETNLLGYEYGGGPSGDGGIDKDPRIQILVYNFNSSATLGYYWAKDFYDQDTIDSWKWNAKTNLAEIFYVNSANLFSSAIDLYYSTMVHEFQHMINFNQKTIAKNINSETWYNEMLSMLSEDVISPLIGVLPLKYGHPTYHRIPTFLTSYNGVGLTEWGTPNTNVSYSITYSFGAYLLRNYGGAKLLQEMLANNSTNIESVTAALQTVTKDSGLSFEESFRRFGEVLIFSGTMPPDVMSFDKTDDSLTINGKTFIASGFDVWKDYISDYSSIKPKILSLTEQVAMRPYSMTVHQGSSAWQKQTGDVTITLQRPDDPNVEFYLMIK